MAELKRKEIPFIHAEKFCRLRDEDCGEPAAVSHGYRSKSAQKRGAHVRLGTLPVSNLRKFRKVLAVTKTGCGGSTRKTGKSKEPMANEKQLLDLLRRCHTCIGEGLIDNGLDEDAAKLHDDLGELLGIPVAKREQVRCTAKWFVSGGRVTRQCRENADPANVCAECGEARCDEHEQDLDFCEGDGRVLCSDCAEAKRNQ